MNLDKWIADIRAGHHLAENEIMILFDKLAEVLYQEPTLVPMQLPITICGDIHGQLYDLFELLRVGGDVQSTNYLFLGDYVDRGYFSLETFTYLVCLKLRYPGHVMLLRGNHECRMVNGSYGLYQETLNTYGHAGVYKRTNEIFDLLPIAAIVNDSILCVHGGLSPSIKYVEQIPIYNRNEELPTKGPLCDLAWSDPMEDVEEWKPNPRGAGFLHGQKQTNEFMHINNLTLIARAHQIAEAGYQWFFGEEKICTVWSAPNYSYRMKNKASVLKIGSDFSREFVIFDAVPDDQRVIPEEIQSQYFA